MRTSLKYILFGLISFGLISTVSASTAISSCSDFESMGSSTDYHLTTDLTCSGTPNVNYDATFDGQGYQISNLSSPVFSSLDGGTVANLTIVGNGWTPPTTTSSSGGWGGLASSGKNGAFVNNVNITGTFDISSGGRAGGYGVMFGKIQNGNTTINNSKVYDVEFDFRGKLGSSTQEMGTGGFVGYAGQANSIELNMNHVKLENSTVAGAWDGGIGGIVGLFSNRGHPGTEIYNASVHNVTVATAASGDSAYSRSAGGISGGDLSNDVTVRKSSVINFTYYDNASQTTTAGGFLGESGQVYDSYGENLNIYDNGGFTQSFISGSGGTAERVGIVDSYIQESANVGYLSYEQLTAKDVFLKGIDVDHIATEGPIIVGMHTANGFMNRTYFAVDITDGDGGASSIYPFDDYQSAGDMTHANSYVDTELAGYSVNYNLIGKNTNEMTTQSTYSKFDFQDTWYQDSSVNDGYPVLRTVPQLDPGDVTPPQVSFNEEETVNSGYRNKSWVVLNTSVSDNNQVSSVVGKFNGTESSLTENNGYYTINKSLSEGNHTINVTVTDGNGNTNTTTSKEVHIDTITPSVDNLDSKNTELRDINITVNVSEEVNELHVSFGDTFLDKSNLTQSGNIFYYSESSVSEGTYYVVVEKIKDIAGNSGTDVKNQTLSVSNTGPSLGTTFPGDGAIGTNTTDTGTGIKVQIESNLTDPNGEDIDADLYVDDSNVKSVTGISSGTNVTYTTQEFDYNSQHDYYWSLTDTDKSTVSNTLGFRVANNNTATIIDYSTFELDKSHDSNTQYIGQVRGFLNNGSSKLIEYQGQPPSFVGSCQNCTTEIFNISVDEQVNKTYESQADIISETDVSIDNYSETVKYGSGISDPFNVMHNVQFENTGSTDLTGVDLGPGIPSDEGCTVQNGTTYDMSSGKVRDLNFEKSCSGGENINATDSQTSLDNSTRYKINAYFDTYTNLTSDATHVLGVKKSNVPEWDGHNDSTYNISVDDSKTNVDVKTFTSGSTEYVGFKVNGTRGLNNGTHHGFLEYTVPDSWTPPSTSSGGGGGGGGGGSESTAPPASEILKVVTGKPLSVGPGGTDISELELQNYLTGTSEVTVSIPNSGACQYFEVESSDQTFKKEATFNIPAGNQNGPGTVNPKIQASVPNNGESEFSCDIQFSTGSGEPLTKTVSARAGSGGFNILGGSGRGFSFLNFLPFFGDSDSGNSENDVEYSTPKPGGSVMSSVNEFVAGLPVVGSPDQRVEVNMKQASNALAKYERTVKGTDTNSDSETLETYRSEVGSAISASEEANNETVQKLENSLQSDVEILKSLRSEVNGEDTQQINSIISDLQGGE